MAKAKLGLVCWIIVAAGMLLVVQVIADDGSESIQSEVAEAPANRRLGKHHSDKSVAGGGVIIGGLVTAVFAAVFCYIRVTRRRNDAVR